MSQISAAVLAELAKRGKQVKDPGAVRPAVEQAMKAPKNVYSLVRSDPSVTMGEVNEVIAALTSAGLLEDIPGGAAAPTTTTGAGGLNIDPMYLLIGGVAVGALVLIMGKKG